METKGNILYKYYLLMFICFVLDSIISYFTPLNFNKEGITLVPCIALMMYLLIIKNIQGAEKYFFGAVCGLFYSIVYANSLAIYILIYVFLAFLRTYIIKFEEFSFFEALLLSILTIFSQEFVVYWLMKITNMTVLNVSHFLMMHALPTLLLNVILFVVVFIIYKNLKIEVS